ncbi:MAG TPA: phosphatidylserine/phosphatidylglycerophosphate/cardiolipin synthase family protein, partial [Candidatus Ozemobacteraceae bacterium]|nr:phosphatidylserine/phosphatidylglycerophosphate/cardiolipin synthase family protein [Candidatus Ozemobacteraceae bacterium]
NRDAYDRYLSTYRVYQDALSRGLPEEQIKKALGEYSAAKSAYEKTIVAPDATQAQTPAAAIAMGADGSPALELPGSVITTVVPSTIENSCGLQASGVPSLSSELRGILEDLWDPRGRAKPDLTIQRLENYIKAHPSDVAVNYARYELAKAYEYLKNDPGKAWNVLKAMTTDPSAGRYANLATERLRYLEGMAQHNKWKSALNTKYQEMNDKYASYRNTSWLAFPVKGVRFASYLGKLIGFNKAQSDYKKFQLWYEELAGKFAPAPDVVFDQFKVPAGSGDPEAHVRLIYTNSEAWYTRWKLINEAKHSIDVQYFIVDGDIFGYSLAGLFLRKAREGVKIRFMMDARGTKGFTRKLMGQDYMQELSEFPNVEIKVFNPVHQNLLTMWGNLRRIMASNHDKIVVVDGEYAIIGGRNISKDYFVDPADHPHAYRDCDVVIRSTEVAKQLDLAFDEEFAMLKSLSITKDLFGNVDIVTKPLEAAFQAMDYYVRGNGLLKPMPGNDKVFMKNMEKFNEELAVYKHLIGFTGFDPLDGAHEAPVKIIDKHSLGGPRNDITDQLVKFIDGSRKEILIQNPYVVLTERAEAALKRAAKRGVRILMHTNSPISTDSLATQAMFYADWKRILKDIPTLSIYTYYGDRKLHAKNFVFDGQIGVVGTYNMDYLSEEVNSEVVAAINSKSFATELRNGILEDMRNSKRYAIEVGADGEVKEVFGPDQLQSSKSGMIRFLSNFGFLKPLI